jgi:hypothetical protein
LEQSFNALNLQRIAGFTIDRSDNIADHLRLVDSAKRVAMFSPCFLYKSQSKEEC